MSIAWQTLTQHGLASLLIFFAGIMIYLIWTFIRVNFISGSLLIFFIIAPLSYLIGVVGTRNIELNGYYWTRWIDPASLIITISFCMGYAIILTCGIQPDKLLKKTRMHKLSNYMVLCVIIGGLGILGFIHSFPSFKKSYINRKNHMSSDSRAIHLINVQTGKWIKENTPDDITLGVNDAGAIRYFGKRRTIDLIGLNNSDIAFKRKGTKEIINEIDWLAIFPSWFQKSKIFNLFEYRTSFQIPLAEYTICNCPGQTIKVIYEKKPAL
jgi:hypothetical protein